MELLITISIIGILSSIAIPALSSARQKAQIVKAKAEIKQIVDAIIVARDESGQTLVDITRDAGISGAGWIGGGNCMTDTDLRGVTQECYEAWVAALNAIQAATGYIYDGLERADRDVWGSPYLVDENEGEWDDIPCRQDLIYSAGPDGIRDNNDDIVLKMPFSLLECL